LKNTSQKKTSKLAYIENLRILLTGLVVVVHVACTYGGPGGWAYIEKGAGLATKLPLTVLNATAQSFFMGMFFFISAYFTQRSLQRKGTLKFSKERLIRLGIPLAITYFFISVVTAYIIGPIKYPDSTFGSFADLWLTGQAFGFGVMWFVLALVYFTAIFLIVHSIFLRKQKKKRDRRPNIRFIHILLSGIIVGVITFVVRIKFPLFTSSGISWLPFDLGHFPQYVFLFIFGIIASRFESDNFITLKQAKNWLWFVVFMILVAFPLLFFLGDAHITGVKSYAGRGTLNSLNYALWEQVTGFSIMAVLWGIFKARLNTQNSLSTKLSNSAYAVYVLHPPVLVGISYIFVGWNTMLLLKFAALAPLALVACFAAGVLLKKIPVLNQSL
jgi:peptidoglycan/LPS O-acetylase OafA/YrhL